MQGQHKISDPFYDHVAVDDILELPFPIPILFPISLQIRGRAYRSVRAGVRIGAGTGRSSKRALANIDNANVCLI